jgi:L-seryl-tRNA(Ser) seleniumtransferase
MRALPSVDHVAALLEGVPARVAVAAARRAIDLARESVRAGGQAPSEEAVVMTAGELALDARRLSLTKVINATGVLIHTNLGRVPLGPRQLDAVLEAASRYTNLEIDLVTGERGDRYAGVRQALALIVGSESALVVNNNAAALLLMLSALCAGKEVIISRGELVEIGGEFRIPEVLVAAGVRLVEVGTTNRTHLIDYERAITPDTAAILKVHPSNYDMVGFTSSVSARELTALASGRRVFFLHDAGSGLLDDRRDDWSAREPTIRGSIEEGADLVTFSGDKLLGGPQAGVIAGRAGLIEKLARHPLLRALRPDKMTLAALQATLDAYVAGESSGLPLWSMVETAVSDLQARADALGGRLARSLGDSGLKVEGVPLASVAGGGSLPNTELGSYGLSLSHAERSTAELGRALRYGSPPVIARIEDDRVLLDLRTVAQEDDDALVGALLGALTP